MVDCRKCQRFSACYFDNDDCIGFVPKQQTNADRIRAMNDEELASYLFTNLDYCEESKVCREKCRDCFLDWLKKEADE